MNDKMMTTLTLAALGFTEEDLWREIRDRWRRPEGEPKTEAEMRSLLRAEMIEEQAGLTLEQRFRWMDASLVERWRIFRRLRLSAGATMEEIVQEWGADRPVECRVWGDGV